MPSVFRWILSLAPGRLLGFSHEFILGEFRIRGSGNSLEVEAPDGADETSARAVAERYREALRRHGVLVFGLMTHEEFASRPPSIMQVISPPAPGDAERTPRTIRLARNELLEGGDPYLKRAYEYVQTAREKQQDGNPETLYDLYKAIETIENALGGEDSACNVLGVRAEIKSVKRMANEPTADERHAPRDPSQTAGAANLALALEQTRTVLRAYERHLQGR